MTMIKSSERVALRLLLGMTLMTMKLVKNTAFFIADNVYISDDIEDFEPLNIFTDEAHSNDNVPSPFKNLDRFKVRKLFFKKLKN